MSTPKEGWRNFDIAGKLKRALKLPVAIDTDVNGAVLGEVRWGAARDLSDALYLTIGTGIGGGAMVGGQLLHGLGSSGDGSHSCSARSARTLSLVVVHFMAIAWKGSRRGLR